MTQPYDQAPPTPQATPGSAPGDGPPAGHAPGYGPGYGPQAGYGPPPGYGYPVAYGAPAEIPGRTLGIVGFILAFFVSIAGIVVSAIARKQSREAGFDNPLATWGLILSIVFTAISVLGGVLYFVILSQIFMLAGVAAY